ncbi:MAG TPA: alpha/beta hydrolase [Propionibacteriaceae bacterium]
MAKHPVLAGGDDVHIARPTTNPEMAPADRRHHHLARAVLAVAAAVTVLLLACAGTERYLSNSDRERFPLPGRLIPVEGAVMHLSCSGTGQPTVLLEAGLGESSLTWVAVQRSLSATTRVCSYDRAGYGWRDSRDRPWTASTAVSELESLLTAAGEPGPYVVVAHSLGSFVAREFAMTQPDQVAGLVLLDPTNEVAVRSAGRPLPAILQRRLLGVLVRLETVRWAGTSLVPALVDTQPPTELLTRLPMAYTSSSTGATIAELEGFVASAEHLPPPDRPVFDDLPVTIVSAATATEADRQHHRSLAKLSRRGTQLMMASGNHYLHCTDPAQVVQIVETTALR